MPYIKTSEYLKVTLMKGLLDLKKQKNRRHINSFMQKTIYSGNVDRLERFINHQIIYLNLAIVFRK